MVTTEQIRDRVAFNCIQRIAEDRAYRVSVSRSLATTIRGWGAPIDKDESDEDVTVIRGFVSGGPCESTWHYCIEIPTDPMQSVLLTASEQRRY